jgi:hypothetical protein
MEYFGLVVAKPVAETCQSEGKRRALPARIPENGMRLSGFEAIVGVVTGQGWGDFRWLKQAAARIRGIAVATRLKLDSLCQLG